MTINLGYSRQSMPSAFRIAEASDGRIVPIQGDGDINWGRRRSTGLNADTSNAVHKRAMREIFKDKEIPSPALCTPDEARALIQSGDLAGWAMIGRPDFHTRGRGFWVVKDEAELDRALRGTRRKMAATHFMWYIATTQAPKEFRVHVFKGKSIRISQKKYMDDERKDYTTVRPDPDIPKRFLRHAAIAAVEALGLDFGTVDMLASDDQTQVWVLEVNCAPGLGGSMPRVWAHTFISFMEGEWE